MLKDLIFLTADKKLQQEVGNFLSEWHNESDYVIVKTSGSTGIPKEYQIKKDHMRISARKTLSTFSVKKGGTAFLCLSTQTIAGKMMVVRAEENNMTLYVGDIRTTALDSLPIHSCDLMAIVPLQLESALRSNPALIKNSKTVLLGGGPVSSAHLSDLKKVNASVIHTYGMTETLSHIAYRIVGNTTQESFTPLSGIGLRSVDSCLVIDYPELGIIGLQTTDEVLIHPNGHFTILGRTDFVINSGGIKFHPEELESKITGVMDRPFFIGGLPDSHLGERLVLVIEGEKKENDNHLLELIKDLLPKHGTPKEIHYISHFVRTESMKIRRKETLSLL